MPNKLKGFTIIASGLACLGFCVSCCMDDLENRINITRAAIMSIFTKTDADLLEKIKKDCDVSVKELDILRRKLEKIYFQGPKGEKLFIELEVNCNSPLLNVELVRLKVVDAEGKEKGDILTDYWVFQNKSVALWDVIAQLINQINSGPDQEWVVMEKDILE